MTAVAAQIATVQIAAASYDLVDLATVKTLLAIPDNNLDAYLKLVITQASTSAANYCNRVFSVETLKSQFFPMREGWPYLLRDGFAILQLSRWPVVIVTSVTETISGIATLLVENTDFVVDYSKGQITRFDSSGYPCTWAANPIVVVYSAGYATIPADIIDATVRLVKAAYFARLRDPQLRSQASPGVYEAAYWFGNGPGAASGLPPDIASVLDGYRIPVFG